MPTDTAVSAPQAPPKHIRLRLGGRDMNLVVHSKGIKPQLIELGSPSAKRPEVISGIEIHPSELDPKRILIKWPQDPQLLYVLLIIDVETNSLLHESQATHADRTSVSLAEIDGYVGKKLYAVLLCRNIATGEQETGLDKWFEIPRSSASVVRNYDEGKERWVNHRRRKVRWRRVLDRTLLILLYLAVFRGIYYVAFQYR